MLIDPLVALGLSIGRVQSACDAIIASRLRGWCNDLALFCYAFMQSSDHAQCLGSCEYCPSRPYDNVRDAGDEGANVARFMRSSRIRL